MKKWILIVLVVLTLLSMANAEGYTAYVQTADDDVLNIRLHNWVGSEVIGRVRNGWDVKVLSVTDNGWAYVETNCEIKYGYIKLEYLTTRPDDGGKWRNNSDGRVRIRETMGGDLARWLGKGKTVNVICWMKDDSGHDWAYTKHGWIDGDYLEKEDN